jgi:glyoxylase-like metal-dependent hydrolase (beta-lactamase superfamily II)
VHRREVDAFTGSPRRWTDLAYVSRHIAHRPNFVLYDNSGERWFDFAAICLPFEPEMWLVPLFGHTRGHCGVTVQTDSGWLFHVGAAAPIGFTQDVPDWLAKLVVGPHTPRLRAFRAAYPDVVMTTGHMWLDFFEEGLE